MSYEGEEIVFCEDGHIGGWDVWQVHKDEQCFCGKKWAWSVDIDHTNGCEHLDNPEHMKQWMYCHSGALVVKTPAEIVECNLHYKHVVKQPTYHFPDKGHAIK